LRRSRGRRDFGSTIAQLLEIEFEVEEALCEQAMGEPCGI
jgi:hypothetical protein